MMVQLMKCMITRYMRWRLGAALTRDTCWTLSCQRNVQEQHGHQQYAASEKLVIHLVMKTVGQWWTSYSGVIPMFPGSYVPRLGNIGPFIKKRGHVPRFSQKGKNGSQSIPWWDVGWCIPAVAGACLCSPLSYKEVNIGPGELRTRGT